MHPDLASTLLFIIGGGALINGAIGFISARTTVGQHNDPTPLRGPLARAMSAVRIVLGVLFILVGDLVINGQSFWVHLAIPFGILGLAFMLISAIVVRFIS